MSKIALFLNHYKVGGAERSALEQAHAISPKIVDVFVPGGFSEIKPLVKNEENLKSYTIPKSLQRVSRSKKTNYIAVFLGYTLSLYKTLRLPFDDYEVIWLNGMKAFVTIIPALLIKKYDAKIFFHLRDYIPASGVLRFLFKLALKRGLKLAFIANSESVKESLLKTYSFVQKDKVFVSYNICGVEEFEKRERKIKKIGLSSMLTPWKGIHSILLFAKIYEKELFDIGIEEISVFGENIYITEGEGRSYHKQLEALTKKLSMKNIVFKGRKKPSEIYSEIDFLLHPSLRAEPFGRIIMEAYGHKIPVVSTGLGGSLELLVDREKQQVSCFHYYELFSKIKELCLSDEKYDSLVEDQYKHFLRINNKARESIQELLC